MSPDDTPFNKSKNRFHFCCQSWHSFSQLTLQMAIRAKKQPERHYVGRTPISAGGNLVTSLKKSATARLPTTPGTGRKNAHVLGRKKIKGAARA
jgi:hypothetical protein